jgi:Domain of unknown function (DUF1906)
LTITGRGLGQGWPTHRHFVGDGGRTLQLTKLAPFVAGLILTACQSLPSPPPPPAIALPARVGSGQGVDLATDTSNKLWELQGSGLEFVARYYREPVSRWPALSASEAQSLSSQGLKIVAVWESHSRDAQHFSYFTGYDDAMMAYPQARAVGQPAGSAIYFAVDFNAQSWALLPIEEYFRGVNAGLAAASSGHAIYAVGVYGSGAVCDAMKRAGLAQYAWLSNSIAWTGSIGYEDWNIRQGGRSPELSFNHDSDEAKGEYGGFQVANIAAISYAGIAAGNVTAAQAPQAGRPLTTAAISAR